MIVGRRDATARLGPGLVATALLATSVAADPTTVQELVERTWFEGLPLERAAALSTADGELLAAMLADPTAAAHHGNIVMALGACGCGPAFEALSRFGANTAHTPREARAAHRAVPQAMGLLARREGRALTWLEQRAQAPLPAADAAESRRAYALVLYGLAQSGADSAGALLAAVEVRASAAGDAAVARWATQANERWQRARRQAP